MHASDAYAQLSPYLLLCNKNALSPAYRVLQLSPNRVFGCAAFGMMEVEIALGIDGDAYVNADDFLQVLRSLPAGELDLKVTSNILQWSCAQSTGKLGLLDAPEMPKLEIPDKKGFGLPLSFSQALNLGSLACGSSALMSVGLYGVLLQSDGSDLYAYASDNATISASRLCEDAPSDINCTLSPDAIVLLCAITRKGQAALTFDAQGVYCATPNTKLALKPIPGLKHDLKAGVAAFTANKITIPLNRDVIASFIRRADALAEERGKARVAISVEGGHTKLAFDEGKSSSEEYYLTDAPSNVSVNPVLLESRSLSRALSAAQHIVFDYAEKQVLVLRGDSGFTFVISGRTAQNNE